MERLYDLFRKAPTLGSLIDPRTVAEDLFALGFDTLRGTVERALKKAETQADPDRAAVGVAAQGIAMAASLMTREFTLVATNVPYLAGGKQSEELRVLHCRRVPHRQGRFGNCVCRALPRILRPWGHIGPCDPPKLVIPWLV